MADLIQPFIIVIAVAAIAGAALFVWAHRIDHPNRDERHEHVDEGDVR